MSVFALDNFQAADGNCQCENPWRTRKNIRTPIN